MPPVDETNLFVTNFSWGKTVEDMKELFAPYGEFDVFVDRDGNEKPAVNLIMDKETGRSRGFGFVKYKNVDDAKAAIAALNGTEVDGRTITVVVARPREERADRPYAPRRNNYNNDNGGYSMAA